MSKEINLTRENNAKNTEKLMMTLNINTIKLHKNATVVSIRKHDILRRKSRNSITLM